MNLSNRPGEDPERRTGPDGKSQANRFNFNCPMRCRKAHDGKYVEIQTLTEAAANGYWFCSDCERITERKDDWPNGCILCGSMCITWNKPVYADD